MLVIYKYKNFFIGIYQDIVHCCEVSSKGHELFIPKRALSSMYLSYNKYKNLFIGIYQDIVHCCEVSSKGHVELFIPKRDLSSMYLSYDNPCGNPK